MMPTKLLTLMTCNLICLSVFAQTPEPVIVREPRKIKVPPSREWDNMEDSFDNSKSFKDVIGHSYFPEGAIRASQEALERERRHNDLVEKREVQAREEVENRKKDAMDQIAKHKREIKNLEFQREKTEESIELLKRQLVEFNDDTKKVEDDLQAAHALNKNQGEEYEKVVENHTRSKKLLESSIMELEKTRMDIALKVKKTEQALKDMEGVQDQISQVEEVLSRSRVERGNVEADLLRVQSAWVDIKNKSDELKSQRDAILKDIAQMNAQLNRTQADYNKTQNLVASLSREVEQLKNRSNQEMNRIANEIERLNDATLVANKKYERNMAEKEKLTSELERAKMQLAIVKQQHEEAVAQMRSADAVVIETRLALEDVHNQVGGQISSLQASKIDYSNRKQKVRNLASLAASSGLDDEMKSMTAAKDCKLLNAPNGEVVGVVKKGTRVIASVVGGHAKVLNSSGHEQYIVRGCLKE